MPDSEDRNASVTAALRALARDDETLGASPEVEPRLLAEVRSIARGRRRRNIATVLAVAAVLILAVALPAWRLRGRQAPPAAMPVRSARSTHEVVTSFFPLTYSNLPSEGAQLVRMQVPRKALVAVGLLSADVPPGALTGTIQADVLVGEDGLARAVRFVRPAAR